MKHHKSSHPQNQKPAGASGSDATGLSESQDNFAPSPDEVARKAYFSYLNEGSQPGHQVQHWLAAEAELIAERQRTRLHEFHNAN